jgi:hypothetical protein
MTPLGRAEVDGAGIVFCGGRVLRIDEIDEQTAFDDVEELVLPLVVVPVIFPFDYSKANHRIVHLAECFVVPGACCVRGELFFYQLEGFVFGCEDYLVGIFGGHLRLLL